MKSDLAELDYTKIYAPMSGTVTSLSAAEGQTLNANQTAPKILTIADLTVMTVKADISEADVLRVSPGQSAYFTILGDSETRWRAKVRQILPEPEVVNDVVLYKALLDVDNPDLILRPEMTAQIFFIVGATKDAVLVPLTALRDGEKKGGRGNINAAGKVVRVVDPRTGKAEARTVEVGLKNRSHAEILSGLQEGETVELNQASAAAGSGNQTGNRRPTGMFRRF